jgi:pimeloyl-ACP methyl ester carboxylesterase
VEEHVAREQDGPSLPLYLSEPGRAAADFGLYLAARPVMQLLPQGDGHPVLVLPGLLADDASTRILRLTLRRLGYRVHGWRLGRNIGPTETCVRGMRDRVAELSDRYGRPMSLIGWSLGGIFARDIARRTPDSVRQVITLGSPFRLERASQTRATRVFDRYSHLHVEHRDFPLEADGVPMPVPATSIYSHFDGIVHWPACLNLPGERCENIAVYASHLGLGHHPAVLYAIADRLAQPEGSWEPFHPPLFLRPAYPHPDEVRPNTPLTGSAPAA